MTCAYAVRAGLMKFSGVESADVSLNKGVAKVKLKAGNSIRPSEFWEVIRRNGNTPKLTRVIARGEILAGGVQLKVSGTNEVFTLKAPPGVVLVYTQGDAIIDRFHLGNQCGKAS